MKEFELKAINELIKIYLDLYEEDITTEKVKEIYDELTPASTLLNDYVNQSVSNLFSFAYPNVDPERKPMSKEEIKNILEKLRSRKLELENDNPWFLFLMVYKV